MMNFNIDFLIIGSRKCATTWVYDNLMSHLGICLNEKVKQSNFFGAQNKRGLDWYISMFGVFDANANKVGEVDPDIIMYPGAQELINDVCPDVKIIVILRNPVELFESSYLHALRKGDAGKSAELEWKNNEIYKRELSYGTLLKPYYELFDEKQIKVIYYDLLLDDPVLFLDEIYNYIGVEKYYDQDLLHARINKRRAARFKGLSVIMTRLARFARKHNLHGLVNRAKVLLPGSIMSKNITEKNTSVFSDELKEKIHDDMAHEISLFESLSGSVVPDAWRYR